VPEASSPSERSLACQVEKLLAAPSCTHYILVAALCLVADLLFPNEFIPLVDLAYFDFLQGTYVKFYFRKNAQCCI
jgi:hypothetical protein